MALLDAIFEPEPPRPPRNGPLAKLTQEQLLELNQAIEALRAKPIGERPAQRRIIEVLRNHFGIKFTQSSLHGWLRDGLPEGTIRQAN